MKKIFNVAIPLLLTITSFTLPSNASLVMGGGAVNELSCTPVQQMPLGVGYRLQCTTATLPPQYNLRGCVLIAENIQRTNKEEVLLSVVTQSKAEATLTSPDGKIQTVLTKSDLFADINIYGVEFKCKRSN